MLYGESKCVKIRKKKILNVLVVFRSLSIYKTLQTVFEDMPDHNRLHCDCSEQSRDIVKIKYQSEEREEYT